MRIIVSLAAVILLMMPVSALCDTEAAPPSSVEESEQFVDLDGDGINDNVRDRNNDGIPDAFAEENSGEGEAQVELLASSMNMDLGMDNVFEHAVEMDAKEPNSTLFSSREFCARDLTQDRGGFDAENRTDSGATRGKICIGGVCF
jgi:hypothetical protein